FSCLQRSIPHATAIGSLSDACGMLADRKSPARLPLHSSPNIRSDWSRFAALATNECAHKTASPAHSPVPRPDRWARDDLALTNAHRYARHRCETDNANHMSHTSSPSESI